MSVLHTLGRTRRLAVLFLALLASAQVAHAEVEVRFTTDSTWVTTPFAEGIVSRTRDGIYLNLSRVVLSASPDLGSPDKVHSVRVGLVLAGPDGQWDVSHWSEPLTLEIDLKPGESVELKKISGIIPIESDLSLTGRWLVIECRHTYQGRKGSTYAHSSRTVLDMLSE